MSGFPEEWTSEVFVWRIASDIARGTRLSIALNRQQFDFSKLTATGSDLRIIAPGGAMLPYERKKFDPVAGLLEVHILACSLRAGDVLRFIGGNQNAPDGSTDLPMGIRRVFDRKQYP